VGAFEQDLVWDAGGDAHDVAGGKLLTSAALNGAVALFVGRDRLSKPTASGSHSMPVEVHPAFCVGAEQARDVALNVVACDAAAVFS
jgi:hypothetical protein